MFPDIFSYLTPTQASAFQYNAQNWQSYGGANNNFDLFSKGLDKATVQKAATATATLSPAKQPAFNYIMAILTQVGLPALAIIKNADVLKTGSLSDLGSPESNIDYGKLADPGVQNALLNQLIASRSAPTPTPEKKPFALDLASPVTWLLGLIGVGVLYFLYKSSTQTSGKRGR